MTNSQNMSASLEPTYNKHNHLLCWKAIFAGILISLLSFMVLTALGAGFGGLAAADMISNEIGAGSLSTGTGLWIGISIVVSLFMGSYFALRISRFITYKIGAAHGLIIAAVFFNLIIWAGGNVLTSMSQGLGKVVGAVGHGAVDLSKNPAVQDTIQKAIGTENLKSDPREVIQGLAIRLLQGDTDSVKSYFSYQTGLPSTEVDARVNQLTSEFDQEAKLIGQKAARAFADAAWTLFVTLFVGIVGAVIGGRMGARANTGRPLSKNLPEVYGSSAPQRA